MYAGHDGSVYKHTDSGWSKYSDGGWNPVQPPADHPDRPANTAGEPGSAPGTRNGGGAFSEHDNYQQLEQDRLGRTCGGARGGMNGYGGGRHRR